MLLCRRVELIWHPVLLCADVVVCWCVFVCVCVGVEGGGICENAGGNEMCVG